MLVWNFTIELLDVFSCFYFDASTVNCLIFNIFMGYLHVFFFDVKFDNVGLNLPRFVFLVYFLFAIFIQTVYLFNFFNEKVMCVTVNIKPYFVKFGTISAIALNEWLKQTV